MYIPYNANPIHARVGDCVIRAISKAMEKDWDETYIDLCLEGLIEKDMPSSNSVWGKYLKGKGFQRHIIPTDCPECYTVSDFCDDYRQGTYILALSGHVVAVKDGNYYDSFDSGSETPIYYWERK